MNYVALLDQRLQFILYVYDNSISWFTETQRAIKAEEPPYEEYRDADDMDGEPPFLDEYLQADAAIDVLALSCLGMIQSAFHMFLNEFVQAHFTDGLKAVKAAPDNKKGWFGRSQSFFDNPNFSWDQSGADLVFLEQINLVRNDDQHGRELFTEYLYQGPEHAQQHAATPFLEGGDPTYKRLRVTGDLLVRATKEVHRLCDFLDDRLIGQFRNRG